MTAGRPHALGRWIVKQTVGSSGDFHQRDLAGNDLEPGSATYRPTIWLHQPSRPALVLGSTQTDALLDTDRARHHGWEVCRRRSGGGLVVVQPGKCVWIDVFIPPDHPAWSDDVGHAFGFLGRWWLDALRSFTTAPLRAHEGPLRNGEIGRLLCFGGIGPGEVSMAVAADGAHGAAGEKEWHKVVGLSQRRTKAGARFQCLALLQADDRPALAYGSPEVRVAATNAPPHGWPVDHQRPTPDVLINAFLEAAP